MSQTFVPNVVLDRHSDEPLYQQIARPLEAGILSGEAAAGMMIEDEVSMAARLHVARPTARRAIQELVSRGLLTRRRGVGTRVTPRQVHRPSRISSLIEDLRVDGFTPSTKILSYVVREATEADAERLGVKVGEGVVEVKRQRLADGQPVAVLSNIIPLDFAPSWSELGRDGLEECLEAHGKEVVAVFQEVTARAATAEEAELLDMDAGEPVLDMKRVSSDADGVTVEVGHHYFRGDRYSIKVTRFAN